MDGHNVKIPLPAHLLGSSTTPLYECIDEEGEVVNGCDSAQLGRPDELQTSRALSYVTATHREENVRIDKYGT
jgi:hypothetical protein